jgi:acetylornithine deacetylase/succinyl-diaminopimelate desuccinylase-like protein
MISKTANCTNPILFHEIREEVTRILSDLIRIDTTNPPGNETEAAKYVSEQLAVDNLESELIESAPRRGNVVSRMKGSGDGPSLLLLSHLDVVPANPTEWTVDPFGGLVEGGFVWGRGALDMKGMTAIEIMTMKLLKRNKVKLRGDVLLAATADEEKGGELGVDYLLKNCGSKVVAEYVLNEGGGASLPISKKKLFTVQTAEKGLLWLKIRTKGKPVHGSTPNDEDNAIVLMNRIIERLVSHRWPVKMTPVIRQFIRLIGDLDCELQEPLSLFACNPEDDQQLNSLPRSRDYIRDEIRPRIRMTITPTIIRGGSKENVTPSECEATFDCRVLPGQSTGEALRLIKRLLRDFGEEKIVLEEIQNNGPSESPLKTPLYDLIVEVLERTEPGCTVLPWLMTGSTDSRFFRGVGSICYGFHPLIMEPPSRGKIIRREHGIDERISIDNLVFGTSVLYETVRKFMS